MYLHRKDKSITSTKKLAVLNSLLIILSISVFCSTLSSPAEAKLLEGRVETVDQSHNPVTESSSNNLRSLSPAGDDTAGGPIASPLSRPQITNVPTVAYSRTPSAAPQVPSYTIPNSFPSGFEGLWRCSTRVVDSAVSSVAVGTVLVSEVRFVKLPGGRIVAKWLQPGWTETQAKAVGWSESEARVDRTSYFFGEGMNGAWASRSRDHFLLDDNFKMSCSSYVDQYVDGVYIGRYRTVSSLTKIGAIRAIAQGEKSE